MVYGRVNHYVETFSGRRINTEYINSRIIPVKEHYRRVAVNARIQGTSADIMRLAMIKLSKELKEKNLGEIINTIHDELIVEAEDGKAEEVQKLMKEMMEKTAKEIIGVDVPVKINVGDDLNFGKELNEDQQETRDHLQENDDFTMSYDDLGYNSLLQEDEEETNDFINNYDLEEEEYRNSCFDILGIEYQVLVSMLCFHRAFSVHGKKYKNLSLATEEDQKKVGKYDDIVIRYIDKEDKKKAINVQVKRIDEEEGYNEIYCTTLFPQGEGKNKDMFAINKYFMSFLEQDKERRDETKYNVIFTNSDLATKDGKKVKYKLLKHSGIEVDEIRDEVLEDLLCANKEQPGFYNFSKGEVREKILKVIDPLQSESRKKVKRILEESTLSKIGIEKIEELLNSPSGKKEKEIKKLIEEVKEQLKPLEKVTKENVLVLLKPLFAAKKFTEKEYKKLIDDFFNKLVLAVNQPNRQELKMIVKKEIEEKIVENNDSSKVFNDFEKKMFGWLEKRIENEGIRITKENSGNYFREINKNADKGINTVTYREDKRYKKTPWVGAMVPRIVYIWELLTFYIYKAFLANKNDKDYEELSIKIGEKRTGENNYTCFNYKDKCTCISFEYKDIREGSREEIFTSIDDHYDYFLKLRKEKKKLEHFVVSVEGFELEEGCDFIGENELKRINFQGKGDHKLLENFFLCEGKEKEGSFYRFSEETIRKLLDKTDEEHKKEKKAFLEILVFKVNLPGREKLESSIQSEIGGEENYYNLKELVLRWIEGPMGMSIDNKIKEEYLKDIKDGKVSKLTYEMAEENKGLIGPIDSFVRTIVGRGEARRFRGFKAFLLNKGVDKFKALISNQALPHISSMLLGVREDCDSSFERLYDKLFDKKGKEKEFLKSFTSSGITLGNVSGMLHGAGSKAPEALETLIETLTKERTINGKNTTYLKFLKDKGILSNVSSMLGSAGSKAPEALETLIETLTKERTINGENTTYLKFLKDKGILSNVSSMLSRAGSQAPEALETLIETLTKERTINEKNTTYLKFLKDKGILSNVSGMLHGAGSKAPEALETLIETLTKERTINGKKTTYLKFLKDKGILSNVSGMLHGRSKAPEALEGSLDALNLKIDGQQGKKTYLECFSEKGITNEVIIGSLREWKKQRSEDYNKRFENYFDRRLKNLTEKNASSQENISSQQQSDKRKLKGSEESTAQNYSKKKKANTEVSSGCSDEERQEVVSCLSEFILNNLPDASVKSVRQGLYLPSFETRGVKINGKCTAITRSLSQALSLQNNKSFLSNLETSAEIYERIAQGKQISKREEREVFAFSKLLNNFERQLDSATNSLPSNLMHNKVYKTFSDLSRDIAEIKGNFAIHLVTSNHVVAIYRTGSNYAYFDSNVAFVSGLKSVDQLMKIVEKAVEFAGYEVGEKGFLVEYFDVEQANKLLSSEGKQILAKEIKTERQLLAEQDKELGLIKINGQEVSRVQLYDFGTKINVEGSVPLLINADMNLSSKKFQDHLGKKEVSMTAREYLGNLKDSKNVEEVVQATKFIPFIGSKCEIEEAKQTRKPKQSLLELAKGIINCILAAVSLTSASWSKSQLPEKAGNEPQTYLNDPTVDKQLQRSRQTISS